MNDEVVSGGGEAAEHAFRSSASGTVKVGLDSVRMGQARWFLNPVAAEFDAEIARACWPAGSPIYACGGWPQRALRAGQLAASALAADPRVPWAPGASVQVEAWVRRDGGAFIRARSDAPREPKAFPSDITRPRPVTAMVIDVPPAIVGAFVGRCACAACKAATKAAKGTQA